MILCCGDSLIDMLPARDAAGRRVFRPVPGGAVLNTARALGRLGVPVNLVSGLSRDLFGEELRAAMAADGVGADLCLASDRPSTLAFVDLRDGQARYAFFDQATAGRMISAEDMPPLPAEARALFFGGISLCDEPCGSAYEALALRAAPERLVMLDPNIRPGHIADPEGYRARLDRLFAVADIVKVSDEDLRWLFPQAEGSEGGAEAMRQAGVKIVLVTEGAKGARAFGPEGRVASAPARKAEVADTVGAGDTFNAGILAWLYDHEHLDKAAIPRLDSEDLAEAMEFANRVAAITVSRIGADPPWRRELR